MRIVPALSQLAALTLCAGTAPTAADIVAKSVDAMGGAAKFAAIDSMVIHGRMRLGDAPFTPFTVTAKRPIQFRMELDAGGDHIVQSYDGTTGWQSVTGQHNQPQTALTGDVLARLIDQAANVIGGPLVDIESRGNQVEFLGRDRVNDVDCFKLKVTLPTGNTRIMFIDATTYFGVQEELPIQLNGQPVTIQQTVGNYRRFGGIFIPCLYVTRQKGGEDTQRIEIDSVEINPAH